MSIRNISILLILLAFLPIVGDATRVAPGYCTVYDATDLAASGIFGDTTGYDFLIYGSQNLISESGSVDHVTLKLANTSIVTDFRVKIWTRNAATGLYSVRSSSGNIKTSISDGVHDVFFSSPLSVEEGDYVGVYIKCSSDGSSARQVYVKAGADAGVQGSRYIHNAASSSMDWEGNASVGPLGVVPACDVFTVVTETASGVDKVAPYYSSVTAGTALASAGLFGDATGYDFLADGHANRIMQTGDITRIRVNTTNTDRLTDFRLKIWSKNEATDLYSVRSSTVNLVSYLKDGTYDIVLPTALHAEEGDFYGIYLKSDQDTTGSRQVYTGTSSSTLVSNVRYYHNAPSSNFAWETGASGTSQNTMCIDLYMDSVAVIWFGDSIISGTPNNVAFTTQWTSTITDYPVEPSTTIAYKYYALREASYQNLGIHGDSFPNLYNRFQNDVIAKKPSFVFIEGGVNDLANSESAESIFSYIRDEITDAQAANIQPIVILPLPAYGYLDATESLEADDLSNLIIDYHNSNSNFVLIDARDDLGTHSASTGWTLLPAYAADVVHLNEDGNEKLAQIIFSAYNLETGIHGRIYDSASNESIKGAVVYVYSENASASTITDSSGSYSFNSITDFGVYYIQVTAEGYDSLPVSMVFNYDGKPISLDIALKKAEFQYAPADATLIVEQGIWKRIVSGANVSVEANGTIIKTGITDHTGQFVVNNIEDGRLYNVTVTYQSYNTTVSFWGSSLSKTYTIRLEESDATTTEQKYEKVDASVTQEVLNTTTAKINATVTAPEGGLTNVTFVLGKYHTNGAFEQLDTFTTTNPGVLSSGTVSHEFLVTNYSGESYTIGSFVTHSQVGMVTEWFSEQFKASNLPISFQNSIALAWFGVFLLFIVAFQFGRAEAPAGALMLVGFFYLLYNWGIFDGFGVSRTAQMIGGAVYAAAFAVISYMISRKNDLGA